MQGSRLRLAILILFEMTAFACSSNDNCIRLSSSSRRCANPQHFANPPPPASPPAAAPATVSSAWIVTTTKRAVPGESTLQETVWTAARPPFGAHDFVALRKITASDEPLSEPRPVLLFLPGPHFHGEIFFPSETQDLRVYLAKRGIETWTLDYRTHFVPREQIVDSRFMESWTTEAFVDDVVYAWQRVREAHAQRPVFLGGFGLGATFAALAAARVEGQGVAGLILLDGYVLDPPNAEGLYRERPPTPNWFADDLESHFLPYKRWIKILQDVQDNPTGPDFLPAPVFDTRAQALAHLLYASGNFGGRGGLSNAKNGRADVVTLARVLQQQDRYWPRAQNHGGFTLARHLAAARFDYARAFRALRAPLLAFSSDTMDNAGILWSDRIRFTAQATASDDADFRVLHDWGHLDVLWGTDAAGEVFAPISEWVKRREGEERRENVENAHGE